MSETALFPAYVSRPEEEQQILYEGSLVRDTGDSRAVLFYGPGGVGKTQLLRALVHAGRADASTRWLDPIDLDDSEYWLLSNFERKIVDQLDPQGRYFGSYLEYLSELPRPGRTDIGYQTVVSHLNRIKRVFIHCYSEFVSDLGTTVVMPLDTVEAIRGTAPLLTLTQLMKALPGTLFVLSGRPPQGGRDALDAIEEQLRDPHQNIPVQSLRLAEFNLDAALRYLETSALSDALTTEEKRTLVHLTQGHPLWLAITLDYLRDRGMPEEADGPLADLERDLPYRGVPTDAGRGRHEAFKRRLVTPYRDADFWHEATKRLAVIRKNVSRPIWRELMLDRPLPEGVDTWEEAWHRLLETPWIRPRANRQYVTLHDAFADEIARRIVPLHDQDQRWRRTLWERAVQIYGDLTEDHRRAYDRERAMLDATLRATTGGEASSGGEVSSGGDSAVIEEVERLDRGKRELDQLRAAHLYYQVLLDPELGFREFLRLVEDARRENDVLFQGLVTMEMQRFLPGSERTPIVTEAIAEAVEAFRVWLSEISPASLVEIGISVADYHKAEERWESAAAVLENLPIEQAPPLGRYRVHNLLGNALMRLPGRVQQGYEHFVLAREEAERLPAQQRPKLLAEAYKELGFYSRNVGRWESADVAYGQAHSVIWASMTSQSPPEEHAELASIRFNWAYVKGLRGERYEGYELVQSAIKILQRLRERYREGRAWSVFGELHRFNGEYREAWDCYHTAEQLFHSLRSWHWLGQVYQQQAVCLYQALQHGIEVVEGQDLLDEAERRITWALDLCRGQGVRNYPSALNRAGRIRSRRDLDEGLRCLREGIGQARVMSDGWFLFANLVEFAELSYEAWQRTGDPRYCDQILGLSGQVEEVSAEYSFPDLAGRWSLVRGHLIVRRALDTGDQHDLPEALRHYTTGFRHIAEGYLASHGVTAIPGEFAKFQELFLQLPEDIRNSWETSLRKSWSTSVVLLARLEELY